MKEGNGDDSSWRNLYDLEEPRSRAQSPHNPYQGFPQAEEEEGKENGKQGLENREGLKVLPFEFVALEACLEAACSCLESEVRIFTFLFSLFNLVLLILFSTLSCNQADTLEQEAHPALDKLTSKISTLNLERVRQIKSRLVAITGRVQKVIRF